jgi:hypothetical protein
MNERTKTRLQQHFAMCSATLMAAAVANQPSNSDAAIVYSGIVNIPIPNNFVGVYVNLVTGATASQFLGGMDFNPYYGGGKMWMGTDPSNRAVAVAAGSNVVANVPLCSSLTFSSNFANTVFPLMTQWAPGQTGVMGLRFRREFDNAALVGWVRIMRGNGGQGAILDWAYTFDACSSDVNADGKVNVDDLVTLINHWGPCTGPCPAGVGDLNHDNTIGMDDLLMVINGWGTCPQSIPAGGCV